MVNIVTAGRVDAQGTEVRHDFPARIPSNHFPCPARSSPGIGGQINLTTTLTDACVISSHTGTGVALAPSGDHRVTLQQIRR
jgi:hypothetical protein